MAKILKKPDEDQPEQQTTHPIKNPVNIIGTIITIAFFLSMNLAGGGMFMPERYVACEQNRTGSCLNELYTCNYTGMPDGSVEAYQTQKPCIEPSKIEKKGWFAKLTSDPQYLDSAHQNICKEGGCKRYLQPGEEYGKKPSPLQRASLGITIALASITGILNRLYINRPEKKKKKGENSDK